MPRAQDTHYCFTRQTSQRAGGAQPLIWGSRDFPWSHRFPSAPHATALLSLSGDQGEDTGLDTDKFSMMLAWSRMVTVPPSPLSPAVPRNSCSSMPAKGNSPVPHSRAAAAFGELAPVFLFPLPLSQGQAEHKDCKQGARGDMGTRDTLWGPGWPGPSPELGEMRNQSLWDQAVPSEQGGAGQGTPGWVPCPSLSPRCPLMSPQALGGWIRRCRSLRWWVGVGTESGRGPGRWSVM